MNAKEFFENHDDSSLEYKKVEKSMIIAASIDNAIKRKGLKNIEFAKLMNVQPSIITRWLSGTHNFTIETIAEIEHALGSEILKNHIL